MSPHAQLRNVFICASRSLTSTESTSNVLTPDALDVAIASDGHEFADKDSRTCVVSRSDLKFSLQYPWCLNVNTAWILLNLSFSFYEGHTNSANGITQVMCEDQYSAYVRFGRVSSIYKLRHSWMHFVWICGLWKHYGFILCVLFTLWMIAKYHRIQGWQTTRLDFCVNVTRVCTWFGLSISCLILLDREHVFECQHSELISDCPVHYCIMSISCACVCCAGTHGELENQISVHRLHVVTSSTSVRRERTSDWSRRYMGIRSVLLICSVWSVGVLWNWQVSVMIHSLLYFFRSVCVYTEFRFPLIHPLWRDQILCGGLESFSTDSSDCQQLRSRWTRQSRSTLSAHQDDDLELHKTIESELLSYREYQIFDNWSRRIRDTIELLFCDPNCVYLWSCESDDSVSIQK